LVTDSVDKVGFTVKSRNSRVACRLAVTCTLCSLSGRPSLLAKHVDPKVMLSPLAVRTSDFVLSLGVAAVPAGYT
jgi:hypothetical protein